MVVFTCNACGDSLKKNQVEKHYMTVCRRCEVLSCVDCGKDFWGDEYQKHTKCISEEEKYSGKNYQPKPNANKGEVKQMQWTQQVQEAIDKSKSHPKLRSLLERMKEYPNIPRKKAKFENFVRNSLNTKDNYLIEQVWDLLIANASQNSQSSTKDQNNEKTNSKETDEKTEGVEQINGNVNNVENTNGCTDKKLSKRERKEERKKQSHKKEKKDKQSTDESGKNMEDEDKNDDEKKAKKKKRKRQEEDSEEDSGTKKQRLTIENGADDPNITTNSDDVVQNGDDDDESTEKVKFNWENVITKVLKKKGEMSLKRLRKKVVAEYMSQGCRVKSEEKLRAKFIKKVNKNPTFLVLKDKVKLKDR